MTLAAQHNVRFPPLSWGVGGGGGGVKPPNFQKGGRGLDKTSTFRGDCWERGGDFFQGGLQFFT